MNTAEEILVIILSATLAILLILAIIAVAMVIRLVRKLQKIAGKAEALADSAEKTADAFRNVVGQISVFKFIQNVVGMVQKHNKKGEKSKQGE